MGYMCNMYPTGHYSYSKVPVAGEKLDKKALLTPREACDSAPWWIVIQYLQRLKMVYFS